MKNPAGQAGLAVLLISLWAYLRMLARTRAATGRLCCCWARLSLWTMSSPSGRGLALSTKGGLSVADRHGVAGLGARQQLHQIAE